VALFSFPKGEKGFSNSIRAISPKNVNVKAENAPSSAKKKKRKQGEAQKSFLRMQSLQRKINADSAESKRRRSF
jgi:hypothetical protein